MGASQNALAVLNAASAEDKYRAACNLAEKWHLTRDIGRSNLSPPDSPARPDNPILVPPAEVPRRRLGSENGRAALLHAVAPVSYTHLTLPTILLV